MIVREHQVCIECKALKEAATSVSTHNNLLYNPVLIWETTNQDRIVLKKFTIFSLSMILFIINDSPEF